MNVNYIYKIPSQQHLYCGEKKKWKYSLLSCVQLFAAPGTVAHQAPLSVEISRQEYWSG